MRVGTFLDILNVDMQWISTIHLDFISEGKIPDKCSEQANKLEMKVIPNS